MFDFQKDCGLQVIKELVKGDTNISRIYGFILYSEKDPYVAKVLRDEDFWKSLDAISGANWPIFAARPLQKGFFTTKGFTPNGIGMLIQTWDEPIVNNTVLDYFGLQDSRDLPLFVAFMWDDNDNLNQVSIHINGNSVDSAYSSLKEIVTVISNVEAAILPEYKGTVNVFRNVNTAIEALDWRMKAANRGKVVAKIADFLSVFIGR